MDHLEERKKKTQKELFYNEYYYQRQMSCPDLRKLTWYNCINFMWHIKAEHPLMLLHSSVAYIAYLAIYVPFLAMHHV